MADYLETKYSNLNKDNSGYENITTYNGYFDKRYLDPYISGYSFIFVTKPNLFIDPTYIGNNADNTASLAYKNMTIDPLFVPFLTNEALNQNDAILPYILSYNPHNKYNSNFIRLFTNSGSSFDPTDTNIGIKEAFDTKQGYQMPLPTHKTMSEASGNLSIHMKETANMDISKMLMLWVNYINNVADGTFYANPDMIKNGELDYMSSIFYFQTEPDGRTLKYWCKYTGVMPTTIPFGIYSYDRGNYNIAEFDAQFSYVVKEDMNPAILEEFNLLALNAMNNDKTIFTNNEFDYLTYKGSYLLNRNFMETVLGFDINSPDRDPVILFTQGANDGTNVDKTADKFQISFPSSIYDESFVYNAVDKFINTSDYAKEYKEIFTIDD